jgi:MFS family permease
LSVDASFYINIAGNKDFWIVSLSHLFTHVFDMMNLALIPSFVEEFGVSSLQAGLLVTLSLLAKMVSSFLSGVILSKFGHKPLMILSLLMMGGSALLVSVTPNFFLLTLYLSLLTFASRLYCPPALSIISESCEDCRLNRGKTIGFHVSVVMLGIASGPIILGLIILHFAWRISYLVFAIPLFLSAIPVARMKVNLPNKGEDEEENVATKKITSMIKTSFILLLVSLGVKSMGIQGVSTFMTTFLVNEKGLSKSISSILYGAGGAFGIIGVSAGGAISDKIGEKRWITITWTAALLSLLAFSLAPSLPILILFFVTYNIFNSGSTAPTMSLIARFTSKSHRGLGYMLYFFSSSLLSAFSPIVTAHIIQSYSIQYIFPFALTTLIFAIILVQLGVHANNTKQNSPDNVENKLNQKTAPKFQ